jgi:hypothetical protein
MGSVKSGVNTHVHVDLSDLLGNVLLCETLGNWITSSKVTVVRNTTALTEAILTSYAQGADMNRVTYDANDDGVVDQAAAITAFTPRTQVVAADSPLTLDYTMDIMEVDTTAGAITLNLPTAIGHAGSGYRILDVAGTAGTNAITVDGFNAQTVDGATTAVINTPRGYLEIFSDGANWNSFNSDVRNLTYGKLNRHAHVAFADSPYTALVASPVLEVTTAGGAVTINLPAVASNAGQTFTILDVGGVAGTSAITVDGNAAELIDGTQTVVLASNFGALKLRCTGTAWVSETAPLRKLLTGFNATHKNVAFAESPYTVLPTDYHLSVTTAGGAVHIDLPAVASTEGQTFIIQDVGGVAGTSAITVDGNAGETIDGVATVDINSNFGVLEIRSDGTQWTSKSALARSSAATIATDAGYHVKAICLTVDLKNAASDIAGVLNGSAALKFIPTHIVMTVAAAAGALNANGTLNIGTTSNGAEISSALALTGLTTTGATRVFPLAAHSVSVAGNATLYANMQAAETGAGTATINVHILGYQL